MKTTMLGLIAETPLHCGSGRSAGIIDLPIAREAVTDFPFLPGTGLKGALRDRRRAHFRARGGAAADDAPPADAPAEDELALKLFGKEDCAGQLLVADGRLLLLPVRCLSGAYRWLTCPLLLERYHRDLARCGLRSNDALTRVGQVAAQGSSPGALAAGTLGQHLFLEEREFAVSGACPKGISEAVAPLIYHERAQARVADQLAIVCDDDFVWFCRHGVPIQTRNRLEDDTKRSMNLWYEESLAPDTLLYTMVSARTPKHSRVVEEMFSKADPYLQIGGNETVGQGWLAVAVQQGAEGHA